MNTSTTDGQTQGADEYCPMRAFWPKGDSVLTAFRYLLASTICEGRRVLDAGCGAGEGAFFLAAKAAEYVGLDRTAHWTANPTLPSPNARFVECDALEMPDEWEARFDVVAAFEIIEHVEDSEAFLEEATRVLAPGGVMLVSTPNFDLMSRGAGPERTPLFEHHKREFTAAQFERLLGKLRSNAEVVGLSELAPDEDDHDKHTFVLGKRVFPVEAGNEFPEIEVLETARMTRALPLEWSQGFIAITGGKSQRLMPGKGARRSGIATGRAAAASIEWILRRKNDQVREIKGVLTARDRQIRDSESALRESSRSYHELTAALAGREGHLRDLEEIVRAREGEIATLKSIITAREEETETLKKIVRVREDQVHALQVQATHDSGRTTSDGIQGAMQQ